MRPTRGAGAALSTLLLVGALGTGARADPWEDRLVTFVERVEQRVAALDGRSAPAGDLALRLRLLDRRVGDLEDDAGLLRGHESVGEGRDALLLDGSTAAVSLQTRVRRVVERRKPEDHVYARVRYPVRTTYDPFADRTWLDITIPIREGLWLQIFANVPGKGFEGSAEAPLLRSVTWLFRSVQTDPWFERNHHVWLLGQPEDRFDGEGEYEARFGLEDVTEHVRFAMDIDLFREMGRAHRLDARLGTLEFGLTDALPSLRALAKALAPWSPPLPAVSLETTPATGSRAADGQASLPARAVGGRQATALAEGTR